MTTTATITLSPEAKSLLNYLHMGGQYAYYWRPAGRKSTWYPAGEYPPLPDSKDVYFGVHPTGQRGADDERSQKQGEREITVINALYAEFDAKDFLPQKIREKYPEKLDAENIENDDLDAGKDRAIEKIITIQPQPSVVIDSGGGFHCYWLLDHAWRLDPTNRTAAAELQARWVEYTGADKGAQDLARILRIPGTLNTKYKPARKVKFISVQFDMIYTLEELQAACKDIKAPERHIRVITPALPNGEGRPGDDYNQKANWESILGPHGWQALGNKGQINYWRRPGKNTGISATTGYAGTDLLYVFSSSAAPLEPLQAYNKFAAYAILNHNGDFKAAAKELARLGFGSNGHHQEPENTYVNMYSQHENEVLKTTDPTPGAFRLDDIGNGERLARRHGWRLRYVKEFGWMIYTGKIWENDRGQAAQLAKETARSIYAEAAACEDDSMRNHLAAWAKTTASQSKRGAMLAAAESEPGIIAEPKDFDGNPWLLNCENGVLDLRTGNLAKHDPALLLTKKAGAAYDPGATCPTWLAFLDRIFTHNQALINFLQRAAGYTLTGNISEQKLFFLYGTGANGKSTFTEALQAALGDYARKTPTETLMQKYQDSGGGPNPDIARLAGARMVSAAELADGRRLNEPLIKDMTGGDKITARYLQKDFFEFTPAFKLWMYGNHQPKITGTDNGIWRRVLLVPFTVSIPEAEQDKKLSERLRAELPGILAWAVEGCLAWQQDGLKIPQEVINATAEYKQSQDTLALFFAERCVINSIATVKARELYNAYKAWAAETNTDAGSEVTFSRKMTEKGFSKTTNTGAGRTYTGIGLVQDDPQ